MLSTEDAEPRRLGQDEYDAVQRAAQAVYDDATREPYRVYALALLAANELVGGEDRNAARAAAQETYETTIQPARDAYHAAVQPARDAYETANQGAA